LLLDFVKIAYANITMAKENNTRTWRWYSSGVVTAQAGVLDLQRRFDTLIDEFLSSQDIGQVTKENYRTAIQHFFGWYRAEDNSAHGTRTPTRQDILRYKEHLKANMSALSVSTYLTALRRFLDWAGVDIAQGIKGTKRVRGFRKDPLTIDQARDLLDHLQKDATPEGLRDYALINLLLRTGLRRVEVARANAGDIRQESGEAVLWIQGKGRDAKDEYVILTHETLQPINEYLKARGGAKAEEPLFESLSDRNRNGRLSKRSISRIVKDRLREINLDSDRLTAHSLRHTAITFALRGGASIQEAQVLARHASVDTTLVYAHNIDRITQAPERKIDFYLDETH